MEDYWKYILFLCFCFWVLSKKPVHAQEVLNPLKYNHVLQQKSKVNHNQIQAIRAFLDTITLPFIDDFSYDSKYPDPTLWIDSQAFVNRSYPIDPPTIGVVTLDGLTKDGLPYSSSQFAHGPADTLTSTPVNLGASNESDSLYFSFFYQPAGRGDFPNKKDSLIVEFKRINGNWDRVWFTVNDTIIDTFKQVLLPVKELEYLHSSFQFRFINYATLSGNNDHWHIDYVKLDKNRSAGDSIFIPDVAIRSLPTSIIKDYTQMPWHHMIDSFFQNFADTHYISVINLFNQAKQIDYRFECFEITETNSAVGIQGSVITNNIGSLQTKDFYFLRSLFNSKPNTILDTIILRSFYYLSNIAGDNNPENDTVTFDQVFAHAYAYDDGTAEKTYGTEGIGSEMAYKFKPLKPDTLRGILMHFAHLNADLSNKLFTLRVWESINESGQNGVGDQVIYSADFQKPKYVDSLNGFVYYELESPVVVRDSFYVGWTQTTPEVLNIGFDKNVDASSKIFYNAGFGWTNTEYKGAVMMRPVIGSGITLGVSESQLATNNKIKLYPNPASRQVSIIGKHLQLFNNLLEIYDYAGRLLKQEQIASSFDISDLPPGNYIVKITPENQGTSFIKKLYVVR